MYNAFLKPTEQISIEQNDHWKLLRIAVLSGEKYIEALLKDKFFGMTEFFANKT